MRNTNGKRNRSSSTNMDDDIDEISACDNSNTNPNKKFKASVDDLCDNLSKKIIRKDNAVIYCRVSTKNQTFGTSLESQQQLCQEYCSENNLNVSSVVNEINSAKNMKNQIELTNILKSYNNITLVVYEPSRLSRNLKDFVEFTEECKKQNITIHFVQDNLDSSNTIDFKKILSGVVDGQTESINLSLRVKRSITHRKLTGNYHPSVAPYGYKYSKERIMGGYKTVNRPNLQEKNIIDLINKLYWGSNIDYINSLLVRITGKPQELYFHGDPEQPVDKIEYGNMRMVDIANFLNSIPILRRNKEWTGTSISHILNK